MHVIYDYIATATIFVLIFTFSMASLLNIVETPVRHLSEQQLFARAETVLGNLLGYTGDPANWGSNITLRPQDLRAVGLSRNLKSDIIYDLDMDKLARLLPIDTGASIDEETLYNLLNLGKDYRFSLHLTPVLNILVTPTRWVDKNGNVLLNPINDSFACYFQVKVTTHELTPVGNVNLTVYILTAYLDPPSQNGVLWYVTNETMYDVTRWNGSANFNYTSFMKDLMTKKGGSTKLVGSLLVVVGNFYSMQTMTIYQCSHTTMPISTGVMIGKYLIFQDDTVEGVKFPLGGKSGAWDSAECVFNGVIVTKVENSTIHGKCPWLKFHDGKKFQVLELAYIEPDIYWVVLVVKKGGEWGLVAFPRVPAEFSLGYGVVPRGTQVVELRRIVFIEKMAFFAEFFFWRTNY
ncbi:MAG: hypothetical protein ACUVTL_04625 [Thermoproteota archaeon]